MTTIPLTEKDVKKYLDESIYFWRQCFREGDKTAAYYIDAFQSVRVSLFGELLD
jgi:hypothetical protein